LYSKAGAVSSEVWARAKGSAGLPCREPITGKIEHAEVITLAQRRRRRRPRSFRKPYVPGISVSLVARPTSCSLAAALCERRGVSGGRWRGCSGSVRVRRVAVARRSSSKKTFEKEIVRHALI